MSPRLFTGILISAVVAGSFFSCKKYDEGPALSLASKKSRLVNTWTVSEMFYDGTAVEPDSLWGVETFEYRKDGRCVYTRHSSGAPLVTSGTWVFINRFEDLSVTITDTVQGIVSSKTSVTHILRLKKNELWLRFVNSEGRATDTHYKTY